MSGISPRVSRRIQERIDGMDVSDPRAWPSRVCKEKMNALPLHGDQLYLWGVRPDGVVLRLDHESFSHEVDEETDPGMRDSVLRMGAAKYPELWELVDSLAAQPAPPPRPPLSLRPSLPPQPPRHPPPPRPLSPPAPPPQPDLRGGTGMNAGSEPAMAPPRGASEPQPYEMTRPVGDWLDRIDRGDQLELQTRSARWLAAGRLAGYYVAAEKGAYWSSPAEPGARQALMGRLVEWERGEAVRARWRENPTSCADPFDSLGHSLTFYGSGTGGTWEDEFARLPNGRYERTLTLHNNFDPAGPSFPESTTREMDADAARVEVDRLMREEGRGVSPFPAIGER